MNLFDRSEGVVETGKLLVTIAAASVDPTGITLAGAGCEAYLTAHKKLAQGNADFTALAKEVDQSLKARLKTPDFHMPKDGEKHLRQMLEAALPAPQDFNDHDLDAEAILNAMADRLSKPEHTTMEITTAFKELYHPVLERLCNDKRLVDALSPALTRKDRELQREQLQEMKDLKAEFGSLKSAMLNSSGLSRLQAEALASQFGLERAKDRSDEELQSHLEDKAEDYAQLLAQISQLDDSHAEIAKLKAEAEAAAEAGDLERVEEVLEGADALETVIGAQTKITRAQTALVRGRERKAFEILSAVADSFGSIDPDAPIKIRAQVFEILYRHGLRYAGESLALAEAMLEEAARRLPENANLELRTMTLVNLAAVQGDLANRLPPELGLVKRDRSIDSYRSLAEALASSDHSRGWASVQNNLGVALCDQANRSSDEDSVTLLAQAVQAYTEALKVRTFDDMPVDWAMTQNNLGTALNDQARRSSGEDSVTLLAQAVQAHTEALKVYTFDAMPVQWAMTQSNLGNALRNQACRSSGEDSVALLAQAVRAYTDALKVRTFDGMPVDWAMTQNNLGNALGDQANRSSGEDSVALLAQAVQAYTDALKVHTFDDMPVQWAETQENLAISLFDMAQRQGEGEAPETLTDALAHVENALTVYDPEHMSYDYGTATKLRDAIRDALNGEDPAPLT